MRNLILKGVVTALLIALVFHFADVDATLTRISRADPVLTAAGFAILTVLGLPHAARWFFVLRCGGVRPPFPALLATVFVGYFFNQTLPTSFGGDAVRVWRLHRAGLEFATALNSVILDRLLALVALLCFIAAGFPWLSDLVPAPASLGLAVVFAGSVLGFAVLLALHRMPAAWLRFRPARVLVRLSRNAGDVLRHPAYVTAGVLLSLLVFFAVCGVMMLLAQSIGVRLSAVEALVLVPPVLLVSMLPVSIAGWGVREGAMIVALGFAGIGVENALAISVLFGASLLAVGLVGGIVWVTA